MNLEVKELSFTYPAGVEALRNITLRIDSGEQVAIVGQNGAGKTTLVRHFNGLLRPTQGSVIVGDWDSRQFSVARLASRVGYVFQNPDEQLFCKTVHDELAFGPRNLGFAADKIDVVVDEALALLGLEENAQTNPYDLSPTWRKMVALASVIAMDTPIIIFDEPTTSQDAASVKRIAEVIAALRRKGKTVITISHDIDFCAENFDRVIALSQGEVLLDGPTREVLSQEEVLAGTYITPPQLTRLGLRLQLPEVILNSEEFIASYRQRLAKKV
jgi:energy-coupling factor transport system ATP-binding protein